MPSTVLHDDEYNRDIALGTLDPTQFDYYFLCEGDSWMDRSSIYQLPLPWALSRVFKGHGGRGNRALFINLARFGPIITRSARWRGHGRRPPRRRRLVVGGDSKNETATGEGGDILQERRMDTDVAVPQVFAQQVEVRVAVVAVTKAVAH